MSLFDLIPTVPEVFVKTTCLLYGHSWGYTEDRKKLICKDCGKTKELE
jgi:hypothetical protein